MNEFGINRILQNEEEDNWEHVGLKKTQCPFENELFIGRKKTIYRELFTTGGDCSGPVQDELLTFRGFLLFLVQPEPTGFRGPATRGLR